MSSNFRFIQRNVDISQIKKQLDDNPDDWKAVSSFDNIAGLLEPKGFLPLVMACVTAEQPNPKNSELLQKTPLYDKYDAVTNWLTSQGIHKTARAAFMRLRPGESIGRHIDEGTYYLGKDRYHLAIQGTYMYEVEDEVHYIQPGTFFWFDNKKYHNSTNIGPDDRITFVFDVPHSDDNP